MDINWVGYLKNQCVAANVPFFFKQAIDENGDKVSLPELDGEQWAQFPKPLLAGMED